MRYMLLIYTHENQKANLSQEDIEKQMNGHWAVMEATRAKGILQGVDPLFPTNTARTVRQQDGKAIVMDGPFAETKEQLAGYYILDCKDIDEAVAWAAKLPTGCGGGSGCVEVRQIQELPMPPETAGASQSSSSLRNG